jgi:hypothetical protein
MALCSSLISRWFLCSGHQHLCDVTGDSISECPRGGDVFLPRDSFPRDSGYAVCAAGVAENLGELGSILKQYRREFRHRRNGLLKYWSQTEYYDLLNTPGALVSENTSGLEGRRSSGMYVRPSTTCSHVPW